ncbi:MAG: CPBP family intramembrane metalloprotease [Clostridia bacterium]|nr:CPBP family intramembrane metalloprotease [Clostridia bacterium]
MKKGLNSIHGIIASILAFLSLLFGGFILIPLFGENGAFLGSALIALIALIFVFATKTKLSCVLPFELPSVKKFFGAVFMFAGVTFISSGLSVIVGRFFDANVRSDAIDSILLKMHPMLAIFLIAVVPAVCEEFFFRGFLIKCFSGVKKEWALTVIIGAIFGVMHLDVYTFLPTALMGALFCFIAIRTKSLIIPMILHFGNNALSVVLTYTGAREGAADAVDLFAFSLPQSVGMSILYIGLGIFPLILGYKMFVGKRVFVFKTFVSFMVAVAICVTGIVTFTIFSFRFVSFENESAVVAEQTEEIPIKIDGEGNFEIFLEISATKSVEIKIVCDETTLYSETLKGDLTLQKSFSYDGLGDCVIILSPIEVGKKSTVDITYVILESVLPR